MAKTKFIKHPLKNWTDQDKRQFRQTGIGGSDVASLPGIGLSKYKSGLELYLEKIGEPVFAFNGNRFTEFGKLHEAEIAEQLFPYYELGSTADDLFKNKVNGRVIHKVKKFPYKLVSKEFYWLFAEIDRMVVSDKKILLC
jgi:predicted phage-related endonuclease